MKEILRHIKDNWIRYGLETFVVFTGILMAFGLSEYGNSRNDQIKATQLKNNLKNELSEIREYCFRRSYTIKNQIDLIHYVMSSTDIHMDSVSDLSKNLFSRRDGPVYIEKHPINFLVTYIVYYDPRRDVYSTSTNDGSLGLLEDLKINYKLSTIYTAHPDQINNLIKTESEINASLWDHISSKYQKLFEKGTWDSPGHWDNATTYSFLENISSDMTLKFLFSQKIQILNVKRATLENDAINGIVEIQQQLE